MNQRRDVRPGAFVPKSLEGFFVSKAVFNRLLINMSKIGNVQFMNTPHKGKFRHIVFRDGDTWYAAALEFNIVESSDDPKLAFLNLLQAVDGYVKSANKIKGSRLAPLNQKSDPEYEKLWTILTSPKPIKSPFEIDMFGFVKA